MKWDEPPFEGVLLHLWVLERVYRSYAPNSVTSMKTIKWQ